MTLQAVNFPVEAPPEWDRQRYQALRDRLIDEQARGFSVLRIALETVPPTTLGGRGQDVSSWKASIEEWARDGEKFRQPSRYFGEPCHADLIETALANWFSIQDRERAGDRTEPGFVLTSVSRKIIEEGFGTARELNKMVEIEVAPGSGKTFTAKKYQAGCRKKEGVDCPVWLITLDETNYNKRILLYLIASAMHGNGLRGVEKPKPNDNEYWLGNHITDMAERRPGGLLIIDEAQNLFSNLKGATERHGLEVVSQLRSYTDRALFGIALLGSGEIYQEAKRQRSAQLTRRTKAWRVQVGKPTEDDIDLIMAAWNVSGKAERAWSIRIGMGEGSIGMLTECYRAALHRYGAINVQTLSSVYKD